MGKPKAKYDVFARYVMCAEEEENSFEADWEHIGTTFAVSEVQAINNVRFKVMGNVSQYKPLATSGHWETELEWRTKKHE